jgi:aspartyl-tRNA(Asn)/glutamyl-tRNA(Gln) amidotransferase subunit B
MGFETVIGLEIHAELLTDTKLFCGCRSVFGGEPNTRGCPVCLGMPGSLPVLNRKVVDMAVMMGHAVGCTIANSSIFARKNYFYPDLPKGYQISQYERPLCTNGSIDIEVGGKTKRIGITRIHVEEDAGKSVHDQDVDTLFDVNRCGTPLIEIVSEPDMRSPSEAYDYLSAIQKILEYIGICDCNLEEGSMRCDANVSIRPVGQQKLGTKTELKNMNSWRNVERALAYEIQRQRGIVESGGKVVQQTVLWDDKAQRTEPMRTKEDEQDYRYFPDPDLTPLQVSDEAIEALRGRLPELPAARRSRFVDALKVNAEHAAVLTDSRAVADYFEQVLADGADVRQAANWVMGDILRMAKERKTEVSQLWTTPQRLAAVLKLVADGTISATAAKTVVDTAESQHKEPSEVVEQLGLRQVSDTDALGSAVDAVLAASSAEVQRYKAGEAKLMGFFVGQVMKATKGKGNPKEINRLLSERLGRGAQ